MELLVLDVSSLARVVARPKDNRPESREYQRILAEMFTQAGDPMDPVAVERWRQRGAIPTARLLTLLRLAKKEKIEIDLLKYVLPAERVERAEGERPSKGRSSVRFDNRIRVNTGATTLYRHFGADGKLLYVGISLSAFARLADHNGSSSWARESMTMTVERFESRKAALEAERSAILTEKPLYNRQGQP